MANGISFWGILVIMIIVAAVASLITMSVTGNSVKEDKNASAANTYTKAEVNLMMDAMKEELKSNVDTTNNFACDKNSTCELGAVSADGSIELSTLSIDVPLRTSNAYVCVDKSGKLYRGTSTGCK